MEEITEIRVFEFSDERGGFQELDMAPELHLYDLLDSEAILLFIDPEHRTVWHWIGNYSTIRMRFRAGYTSLIFRDKHAFAFRLTTVDEGLEPQNFKVMVGLEDESAYVEEDAESQHREPVEDDKIFDEISKEDILLKLKKSELPEGYERKMVVINGDIFYYREYDDNFGEVTVKGERLFALQEQVDDGSYLMDGFTPRLLFSYNKIVLIELLQKIET